MSTCPALEPTSVAYLTGGFYLASRSQKEADIADTCTAVIPLGLKHDVEPVLDLLWGIGVVLGVLYGILYFLWMRVDLRGVAHFLGKALGTLTPVLRVMFGPILWVLNVVFGVVSFFYLSIFSLISIIVGILISPLLIPLRLARWTWGVMNEMYEEFQPVFQYFSLAVIIGLVAGTAIAFLTRFLVHLLRTWVPFLRPPRQRRPTRNRQPTRHHQHPDHHGTTTTRRDLKSSSKGKEKAKDLHPDSAIYWSSSSSDDLRDYRRDKSSAATTTATPSSSRTNARYPSTYVGALPPLSPSSSSSLAKSSRRTLPAGVRVADTIHEESSD
ncbi:uncharacterized protein C8A04DRAFT_12121 [Dichotomopilus funicola]|uniref:Uncharacterized protein n=1 Tax=Dichotomopilus funicola TaxID=1934379 RepID=A0AAN6ZLL3_9PEZI|nr:hypothetical protein C8A04DRAFT_12121 [Dichotomopilus funicola]